MIIVANNDIKAVDIDISNSSLLTAIKLKTKNTFTWWPCCYSTFYKKINQNKLASFSMLSYLT